MADFERLKDLLMDKQTYFHWKIDVSVITDEEIRVFFKVHKDLFETKDPSVVEQDRDNPEKWDMAFTMTVFLTGTDITMKPESVDAELMEKRQISIEEVKQLSEDFFNHLCKTLAHFEASSVCKSDWDLL